MDKKTNKAKLEIFKFLRIIMPYLEILQKYA